MRHGWLSWPQNCIEYLNGGCVCAPETMAYYDETACPYKLFSRHSFEKLSNCGKVE